MGPLFLFLQLRSIAPSVPLKEIMGRVVQLTDLERD